MCSAEWQPRHAFFIAIDSDGCVFDSMEIKIQECFIPNIISVWELEAIAPAVYNVAEFVNLYSRGRGKNRFVALLQFFELLKDYPGVRAEDYAPPDLFLLRSLVTEYGNPDQDRLREKALSRDDAGLQRLVRWNDRVNASVTAAAGRVAPFPWVRESLEKLAGKADMLVTSVAPQALLQQQWYGHQLAPLVAALCGQELGSKVEHLRVAQSYASGCRLMIGDAPSDLAAARAREIAFYPILPGREKASWELFYREVSDLFLQQKYTPLVENRFVTEFLHLLPERPSWLLGAK